MSKLNGKVALITGGNSGIGLATAKLYKKEGAQVVITASSSKSYERSQQEYGREFDVVQADVSKLDELDKLISHVQTKFGKIDILFANAGIAEPLPFEQATESSFDRHFDINVKGLFFTIHKALPLLSQNASIILNASIVASKGFAGMSIYSATKAAVRNLARTLTAELAPRGIRINVLSPGPVSTPIYDKMGLPETARAEFETSILEQVPLGRFGRPEEMATIALFLGSNDSSYMTGAEISADGGAAQV